MTYVLVRDLRGSNGSIGILAVKLEQEPLTLVRHLNEVSATVRIMILYTSGGWIEGYNPVSWQETEAEFMEKVMEIIEAKKRLLRNYKGDTETKTKKSKVDIVNPD